MGGDFDSGMCACSWPEKHTYISETQKLLYFNAEMLSKTNK